MGRRRVGEGVGLLDGLGVGLLVMGMKPRPDGAREIVGRTVGLSVGLIVGSSVGGSVGISVGEAVGYSVGSRVG